MEEKHRLHRLEYRRVLSQDSARVRFPSIRLVSRWYRCADQRQPIAG